jgi:hypothetical protein
MSAIPPPIVNEENRVILRGELAAEVIHDICWTETPNYDEFQGLFEIVSGHHLGDPKEDYYQGVTWTALIKRKADGKLFGFSYWKPVAKHNADTYFESNAEEHGIETEYDEDYNPVGGEAFVFMPVREFTVTGYEVEQPTGEDQ